MNKEKRLSDLIESFKDKTPKQMRTIRNNLNNRIRSFEDEMRFGKKLPKISESHMFYDFNLKDLKLILEKASKELKNQKRESYEDN